MRERERERDRDTEAESHMGRHREADKQRDIDVERRKDGDKDKQRDMERETEKIQTVCIGGHNSQKTLIEFGIPQGMCWAQLFSHLHFAAIGCYQQEAYPTMLSLWR